MPWFELHFTTLRDNRIQVNRWSFQAKDFVDAQVIAKDYLNSLDVYDTYDKVYKDVVVRQCGTPFKISFNRKRRIKRK